MYLYIIWFYCIYIRFSLRTARWFLVYSANRLCTVVVDNVLQKLTTYHS